MSEEIVREARLFSDALLLGVALTFAYDGIIILRIVFVHPKILTSIEDALYWFVTAIAVFLLLYELNNGVIRWFFIVGVAIGMLLYKNSVSKIYIKVMSTIIRTLLKPVKKAFFFIKKLLTVCIKSVTLALCKR